MSGGGTRAGKYYEPLLPGRFGGKRRYGSGGVEDLGGDRYRLSLSLGCHPSGGRRRLTRVIRAESRRAAEQELASWLRTVRPSPPQPPVESASTPIPHQASRALVPTKAPAAPRPPKDGKRFPFALLEEVLGRPGLTRVAAVLEVHHRQVYRFRAAGLTSVQADELAVRAGLHPLEVWPDWR